MLDLYFVWRGSEIVVPVTTPSGVVPVPAGRIQGPLPFAGGIMDQPCCVMRALHVMQAAERALNSGEAPESGEET